jgi:hypothetical protein
MVLTFGNDEVLALTAGSSSSSSSNSGGGGGGGGGSSGGSSTNTQVGGLGGRLVVGGGAAAATAGMAKLNGKIAAALGGALLPVVAEYSGRNQSGQRVDLWEICTAVCPAPAWKFVEVHHAAPPGVGAAVLVAPKKKRVVATGGAASFTKGKAPAGFPPAPNSSRVRPPKAPPPTSTRTNTSTSASTRTRTTTIGRSTNSRVGVSSKTSAALIERKRIADGGGAAGGLGPALALAVLDKLPVYGAVAHSSLKAVSTFERYDGGTRVLLICRIASTYHHASRVVTSLNWLLGGLAAREGRVPYLSGGCQPQLVADYKSPHRMPSLTPNAEGTHATVPQCKRLHRS